MREKRKRNTHKNSFKTIKQIIVFIGNKTKSNTKKVFRKLICEINLLRKERRKLEHLESTRTDTFGTVALHCTVLATVCTTYTVQMSIKNNTPDEQSEKHIKLREKESKVVYIHIYIYIYNM